MAANRLQREDDAGENRFLDQYSLLFRNNCFLAFISDIAAKTYSNYLIYCTKR